jgi:hypothetical protein
VKTFLTTALLLLLGIVLTFVLPWIAYRDYRAVANYDWRNVPTVTYAIGSISAVTSNKGTVSKYYKLAARRPAASGQAIGQVVPDDLVIPDGLLSRDIVLALQGKTVDVTKELRVEDKMLKVVAISADGRDVVTGNQAISHYASLLLWQSWPAILFALIGLGFLLAGVAKLRGIIAGNRPASA